MKQKQKLNHTIPTNASPNQVLINDDLRTNKILNEIR
jgi:hypothetical protein